LVIASRGFIKGFWTQSNSFLVALSLSKFKERFCPPSPSLELSLLSLSFKPILPTIVGALMLHVRGLG